MKNAFGMITASLVIPVMASGCSKIPTVDASALVGTWKCVTAGSGAMPDVKDDQTFSADGWFSSSKFPEGKKFKYKIQDGKLMVTFTNSEWLGKISRLKGDTLEYLSDEKGESKVSCTRN